VNGKRHAVALSRDEVERILEVCGARALLVGGQSLAFWALHYGVRPVGALSESITTDVDFIGTASVAAILKAHLGDPWQLHETTLDDGGGQTAKVYQVLPDNGCACAGRRNRNTRWPDLPRTSPARRLGKSTSESCDVAGEAR
jgi:hypothetical protein